jgi:hypothetical protein
VRLNENRKTGPTDRAAPLPHLAAEVRFMRAAPARPFMSQLLKLSDFGSDTFSRSGAESLARRIADYWLFRGHNVNTWVESVETLTGRVYVVRSDLVNGYPKGQR